MVPKLYSRAFQMLTGYNVNANATLLNDLHDGLEALSDPIDIIDLEGAFPITPGEADLKELLDQHGSDKANHHNYHKLYAHILNRKGALRLLEIGIGTNNISVPSNMGKNGTPGASLRAFRDWAGKFQMFGADVDKRSLFTEERIQTFYVDQTIPTSVRLLADKLPDLDLVIDDGLHTPQANFNSLRALLPKTKLYVVEDILERHLAMWRIVPQLLPGYSVTFFRCLGKSPVYLCSVSNR